MPSLLSICACCQHSVSRLLTTCSVSRGLTAFAAVQQLTLVPIAGTCLQVASETHVFIFDLMALNTEPALDTLLSRLLQSTQVIAPCS